MNGALVALAAFAADEGDDSRLREWVPWVRLRPRPPDGERRPRIHAHARTRTRTHARSFARAHARTHEAAE
eukprot:6172152-Prymnesium_polylepis.1